MRVLTAKFDLGDPKKDEQNKQKKGIAACK